MKLDRDECERRAFVRWARCLDADRREYAELWEPAPVPPKWRSSTYYGMEVPWTTR